MYVAIDVQKLQKRQKPQPCAPVLGTHVAIRSEAGHAFCTPLGRGGSCLEALVDFHARREVREELIPLDLELVLVWFLGCSVWFPWFASLLLLLVVCNYLFTCLFSYLFIHVFICFFFFYVIYLFIYLFIIIIIIFVF